MDNVVSELRSFLVQAGFPIITVIVVIALGLVIIKCLMRSFKRLLLQSNVDKLLVKFLLIIIKICLYVALFLYAFSVAGFPLSGFVAALSAVTLAIGLAIQDIIAGVASGIMLVTAHPFKIGDYVELGGLGGSVKEVSLFHTMLTTPDNKKILIPNKSVFGNSIVNFSANPTRRLDIVVGLSYESDSEEALNRLIGFAKEHPLVLSSPEPVAMIKNFADSNVDYLLRMWVNSGDYWTVCFDLNKKILQSLDGKVGMSYPRVVVSKEEDA